MDINLGEVIYYMKYFSEDSLSNYLAELFIFTHKNIVLFGVLVFLLLFLISFFTFKKLIKSKRYIAFSIFISAVLTPYSVATLSSFMFQEVSVYWQEANTYKKLWPNRFENIDTSLR